jgi:hypothetical protein
MTFLNHHALCSEGENHLLLVGFKTNCPASQIMLWGNNHGTHAGIWVPQKVWNNSLDKVYALWKKASSFEFLLIFKFRSWVQGLKSMWMCQAPSHCQFNPKLSFHQSAQRLSGSLQIKCSLLGLKKDYLNSDHVDVHELKRINRVSGGVLSLLCSTQKIV